LQVAMHDTAAVSAVKALGDLRSILDDVGEWQRAAAQAGGQGLAVDQLHHQIFDPILAANIVQHANVGMIQSGDGSRFPLEALFAGEIVGKFGWKYFDSNFAAEARVPGAINFAHSAGTEGGDNF